jgi:hypothetical protein
VSGVTGNLAAKQHTQGSFDLAVGTSPEAKMLRHRLAEVMLEAAVIAVAVLLGSPFFLAVLALLIGIR